MKKKVLFVVIIAVLLIFLLPGKKEHLRLQGQVFGTSYGIQYFDKANRSFQNQIDSVFYEINASMSTYLSNSIISKVNRNEDVEIDTHFERVFLKSKVIHQQTNGAFDPTIGPVVNAWDFGPEGNIKDLDSLKIDSLMQLVGFSKVELNGQHVKKENPNMFIDFNAIAKGYGVDAIAEFLRLSSIDNYLVEIGGEIRVGGENLESGNAWKVGIEEPRFDGGQSLLKGVSLKNESLATSGTYRKFKVDENGNKYSHIIDAKTGFPSKTNLLSISVIAEDCMTADAYATAFKAMGVDGVKQFLKSHPELKVFLIFENDSMELETLSLNGFPEN